MADITGLLTLEEVIGNEYFAAVVIFIASLIIAKAMNFILKKYVKKLTERTKSDLDDMILKVITRPMDFLIITAGLYFAFKRLSAVVEYAEYVDIAFLIISVLIASLMVARVLSVLINHWLRVQKKYEQTPKLISKMVAAVVYIIAILIILAYFNIEITPIIAALGLGGLAIGLALQETLSNFFSGLTIITDRPVNVGDFVEIQGVDIKGYVEDISWRSTRIKTLPNTIVIVPNSKLANSIIINNSMPEQQMSLVVPCGVSYESDLDKVEKITIEVAKEIQKKAPGTIKDFEPFIRYNQFGDSNINFSVIMRVNTYVDRYATMHEFIKALKKRFDKEGIEISWPVRKIFYGGEGGKKRKK